MTHPIYEFLLSLPKGKVTTYKALGEHFQLHPRTIASILSQNTQTEIYPCYKVVHADGKIGGYNLGIPEKTKRLMQDGVILHDGIVAKSCILDTFFLKL